MFISDNMAERALFFINAKCDVETTCRDFGVTIKDVFDTYKRVKTDNSTVKRGSK